MTDNETQRLIDLVKYVEEDLKEEGIGVGSLPEAFKEMYEKAKKQLESKTNPENCKGCVFDVSVLDPLPAICKTCMFCDKSFRISNYVGYSKVKITFTYSVLDDDYENVKQQVEDFFGYFPYKYKLEFEEE